MYRQNYPDDPGMHNQRSEAFGSRRSLHQTPTFLDTIKSFFLSILVGFVLICCGCVLLFWNEGRTVQTYRSLEEGLEKIRSLDSEVAVIKENNNKFIHITGHLKTVKPLYDSEYGVSVTAVKLKRIVEMYQWVEHEDKREIQELDHIKTAVSYSYSQEWKEHLIDSNSFEKRFGHENPEHMAVKSKTEVAKEVLVGSFYLSENLIDKVTDFRRLEPIALNNSTWNLNIKHRLSTFYHSEDPDNPQVGDMRVWFEYAGRSGLSALGPPEEVSVIGRQNKNSITSFQTSSGDELEILYMGRLTAEQIIRHEQASNVLMSWGLRFLGWLLLFIAFTQITSFISAVVRWLPVIRDVVSLGMLMMSFSLSLSISLTVIAFGWLWYRPFLGVIIFALAALPFVLARMRRERTRGNRTDRIS